MLGQRFLSKATFASPIKPGIMETPPASQRDKQMQNLTSVAFLLARHLALSVEQCTLKLTKMYDSVSKNGILRTQVCSASASEVSVLFLLCRELFCLYTLSNFYQFQLHCLFDLCLLSVCVLCELRALCVLV